MLRPLTATLLAIAFAAPASVASAAPALSPVPGCDGTKHPGDGTKAPKPSADPECGGTKKPEGPESPAPSPPKS